MNSVRWLSEPGTLGATPAEVGVAKLQLLTWAKGNNIALPIDNYGLDALDLNIAVWSPRDEQALGAFSKWWNDQGYQPLLPARAKEPLSDTHRLALAQWAGGEAPKVLQIPGWPTGFPMPPMPPGWAPGVSWPPLGQERPPGLPSFVPWPLPQPPGWPAGIPWPPPLPALPGPTSVPTAPPQTKKSNTIWWVLGAAGIVGVLAVTLKGGGGAGGRRGNPHGGSNVPNLDGMSRQELIRFASRYESNRNRAVAKALVGDRPGYLQLARDLGHYARNKSVAMKERDEGRITSAEIYEKISDDIYRRLPADLRW